MNRKIAMIVIGISLVLVTLVFVFYLQFRSKLAITPLSEVTPTPALEEMTTWTDPAQFSFQYPKSLSLNPHNEDQINYAHVELTSATYSGSLIVWVKDTTANTLDNWVTQNKVKNAIDSELASVPAKKVLAADETNKITLSTINYGYLYQIEVNPTDLPAGEAGNDFWNKVFNQVSASFKFLSSEENTNKQDATGTTDQGTSDGEEVIE